MTPSAPVDPELRRLPLGGGHFAHSDSAPGSDRPVLVAIHGAPGSSRDYRWLEPGLVPELRVVRLDLPGYGGTDWQAGPGFGLAPRADFVLAATRALGIERFVVMGHSQGGGVAAAVAAQGGDRVAGLALLASIGLQKHRGFVQAHVGLIGGLLALPGMAALLREPLAGGFREGGFPASLSHEERVLTMRSSAAISFAEQGRNLRQVRCPTLAAWASDDPLIQAELSRALADLVPPGPRLCFDTGGHNIQKSRAVELSEALVPFVLQRA